MIALFKKWSDKAEKNSDYVINRNIADNVSKRKNIITMQFEKLKLMT